MLAYDFYKYQSEHFDIIRLSRKECDITSFESILQSISLHEPDVVLNCAAYTAVDDAEDIGMKANYDINALWVYNLAKASAAFGICFITISTDYVFDWAKPEGYLPADTCNPINSYGMAKYLWERLALDVNPDAKIIRTSWLYGGEILSDPTANYPDKKNGIYKNFVNTMLMLSSKYNEVTVIDDQHGRPTNCQHLSECIASIIKEGSEENIFHFSSKINTEKYRDSMTWADFAEEIFAKYRKNTTVKRVSSEQFPTKARRPHWSILL